MSACAKLAHDCSLALSTGRARHDCATVHANRPWYATSQYLTGIQRLINIQQLAWQCRGLAALLTKVTHGFVPPSCSSASIAVPDRDGKTHALCRPPSGCIPGLYHCAEGRTEQPEEAGACVLPTRLSKHASSSMHRLPCRNALSFDAGSHIAAATAWPGPAS